MKTETEWAVRWLGGVIHGAVVEDMVEECDNKEEAERLHNQYPADTALIQRTVTYGEWENA